MKRKQRNKNILEVDFRKQKTHNAKTNKQRREREKNNKSVS